MMQCINHPRRKAIDECEGCKKPMCLKCKTIYRRSRGSGDSFYEKKFALCPNCYVKYVKRDNTHIFAICGNLFGLIFCIGFTIVAVFQTSQTFSIGGDSGGAGAFFAFVTIFIIGGGVLGILYFLYRIFIGGPIATKRAKRKRNKIL